MDIAVIEEFFDVAVIGSGFGGAVTACRMAEAGCRVLVLERGRRYRPGEFPRDSLESPTDFWDPSDGMFGPFQVWSLRHLDVIVPSGVGGGSLICAAPLAWMPEEWFAAHATDWPLRYSDIAEHYRTVETMMIGQPASLALAVAGGGGGSHSGDLFPVPGERDWGSSEGTGGTEDFYLAQAQRWGAEIRPLHEVKRITAITGGYELDYVIHRPTPSPGERVRRAPGQPPALRRLRARTVVLAAGALGSTWLLLTNRPGLPYLSGQLGTRFSGNGDAMGFLTEGRDIAESPRGSWGTMRLTDGRLDLDWSSDGPREYLPDFRRLSRQLGLRRLSRQLLSRDITTQPLGGCPMGKNAAYGVVDKHGEAFGHPGLFVADGSVLPAPVGAHPSLTIAALAERFADKIVERSR
jgi:cholesterol oxidase